MGTTLTEEQYHLKWNDYHCGLTKCFRDLRENNEMLDVTIISEGETFKAHKLVLSACSPVFKTMLNKMDEKPYIFMHGARYEDIQAILDFMYNGEVSVNQDDLRSFLSIAEDLRVRGLTQNDCNSQKTEANERKTSQPRAQFTTSNGSRKRMRFHSEENNESDIRKSPNDFSSNYENVHSTNQSNQINNRNCMISKPSPQSPHTSQNLVSRRGSSSMEGGHGFESRSRSMDGATGGNVSYHYLGGRDHGDPLSNITVVRSDRGWHCPDCVHIATTKGNLKSHIMSGRHKVSEKSFKCQFCDRSYSTKQSMQVHISTNHRQERDSISLQGLPNAQIPGSINDEMRGFTKIHANDSDDEDSDEIHSELPVETTFDENSNDNNDSHQKMTGSNQVQRSAEQHLVQEYHDQLQSRTNGGITIKTHYDN